MQPYWKRKGCHSICCWSEFHVLLTICLFLKTFSGACLACVCSYIVNFWHNAHGQWASAVVSSGGLVTIQHPDSNGSLVYYRSYPFARTAAEKGGGRCVTCVRTFWCLDCCTEVVFLRFVGILSSSILRYGFLCCLLGEHCVACYVSLGFLIFLSSFFCSDLRIFRVFQQLLRNFQSKLLLLSFFIQVLSCHAHPCLQAAPSPLLPLENGSVSTRLLRNWVAGNTSWRIETACEAMKLGPLKMIACMSDQGAVCLLLHWRLLFVDLDCYMNCVSCLGNNPLLHMLYGDSIGATWIFWEKIIFAVTAPIVDSLWGLAFGGVITKSFLSKCLRSTEAQF